VMAQRVISHHGRQILEDGDVMMCDDVWSWCDEMRLDERGCAKKWRRPKFVSVFMMGGALLVKLRWETKMQAKLQIPDSVPVPKTTESTSWIPFSSVPTVIPKKSDGSAVSHLATPTADRPRNVPLNSADIRNRSQFRPEYLKEWRHRDDEATKMSRNYQIT
jgi:hypothetical protein